MAVLTQVYDVVTHFSSYYNRLMKVRSESAFSLSPTVHVHVHVQLRPPRVLTGAAENGREAAALQP